MGSNILRAVECLFLAVCLLGWTGVGFAAPAANTATGIGALIAVTTGDNNTADGYAALFANTTGSSNTAAGAYALQSNVGASYNTAGGYTALFSNITGENNTATGASALYLNTGGSYNTADGVEALFSNVSGRYNTAVGVSALFANTIGSNNTAEGAQALFRNTSGAKNTAFGFGALYSNTTGLRNTALGYNAGRLGGGKLLTGSDNIYIGANASPGSQTESNTIRIGKAQTRTHIAGIYGSSVGSDGTEVYVNYYGRLGSVMSSRRYKEAIEDMGDASSGLMKLRPVTFRYKSEYAEGPSATQYGLIAEEVAEVYPDLVQYDPQTGQPQTVHYRLVNAMLLNELQKQHKELSSVIERLKEQNTELSALKEQVRQLTALVAQNMESPGRLSKLDTRLDR